MYEYVMTVAWPDRGQPEKVVKKWTTGRLMTPDEVARKAMHWFDRCGRVTRVYEDGELLASHACLHLRRLLAKEMGGDVTIRETRYRVPH